MGATIWTPLDGAPFASIWQPGTVTSYVCSLPEQAAIDFEPGIYVMGDNFSDPDLTTMEGHEPDKNIIGSTGPWAIGSGEMYMYQGSMCAPAGTTSGPSSAYMNPGGQFFNYEWTYTATVADYSKEPVDSTLRFSCVNSSFIDLGNVSIQFTRATTDGQLQAVYSWSLGVYGSGTSEPINVPDCTWIPVAVKFDFNASPNLCTVTINGTDYEIELIEEGWNHVDVLYFTFTFDIGNDEANSFRIADASLQGVIAS